MDLNGPHGHYMDLELDNFQFYLSKLVCIIKHLLEKYKPRVQTVTRLEKQIWYFLVSNSFVFIALFRLEIIVILNKVWQLSLFAT